MLSMFCEIAANPLDNSVSMYCSIQQLYSDMQTLHSGTGVYYRHHNSNLSQCSPGRRWSAGGGEGRSRLGRQEGVPADVVCRVVISSVIRV